MYRRSESGHLTWCTYPASFLLLPVSDYQQTPYTHENIFLSSSHHQMLYPSYAHRASGGSGRATVRAYLPIYIPNLPTIPRWKRADVSTHLSYQSKCIRLSWAHRARAAGKNGMRYKVAERTNMNKHGAGYCLTWLNLDGDYIYRQSKVGIEVK